MSSSSPDIAIVGNALHDSPGSCLGCVQVCHAICVTAWHHVQEKEAALGQLADVAQRQKACIAALHREHAELAARSADPAQVAALRSEAAALQRRLMDLNALKVMPIHTGAGRCHMRCSVLVHKCCLPVVRPT